MLGPPGLTTRKTSLTDNNIAHEKKTILHHGSFWARSHKMCQIVYSVARKGYG